MFKYHSDLHCTIACLLGIWGNQRALNGASGIDTFCMSKINTRFSILFNRLQLGKNVKYFANILYWLHIEIITLS